VGETKRALTPVNQEAKAQVVQDVVVVPSPQLQAPVEVQASRHLVAQASLCSIPTRQSKTRGVASQRLTYQVRSQPTTNYLFECYHMIKYAHDQREYMPDTFLAKPRALVKEIEKKLQLC